MKIVIAFLIALSHTCFAQSNYETGKRLYEERKLTEAQKLFKAINDSDKNYAGAQYYLGRIAFDEKRFDDAEELFEEAIDGNANVADYHLWYGNTLGNIAQESNVVKQGLLAPKMKSAWEKAVELNPQNIEPRMSLIQFYLQAPGFMGGSVPKAKEMATEIIKAKPAEGHRQMGNIYAYEKNIAMAEKEFIAMSKADPAYTSALGNFYFNQQMHEKLFALTEEELKKNPENQLAGYQYGRTSAVSGRRLEQGEKYLKKYLGYTPQRNEPSIAGANMRLGQIMEKKGNKTEAKRYYETAIKLDPNLKEAKEGLERVGK